MIFWEPLCRRKKIEIVTTDLLYEYITISIPVSFIRWVLNYK